MRALAFSFFLLATTLNQAMSATTYYVDFVGGLDGSVGTSTNAPWQHCPGDSNATSTASSTALVAGDTVRFKGGVTYIAKTGITNFWSGSAGGGYISYEGNLDGTWGTGYPALTSTNNPISMFEANGPRSYLRFVGLMITNVGGYRIDDPIWGTSTPVEDVPGGSGFYFPFYMANIIASNNVLSQIGQWTNAAPMSGTGSVSGNGFNFAGGSSNIVIVGNDISRTHTGIGMKGVTQVQFNTLARNKIHNFVNWGMDITTASGGVFYTINIGPGNEFYDCAQFDNNNWTGFGDSPHRNGIFLRTANINATWTNRFNIFRNSFLDDDTNAAGGSTGVYLSAGASANVFFNRFSVRASDAMFNVGFAKSGPAYQLIRCFNNSTVGTSTGIRSYSENTVFDEQYVLNNLIYRLTSQRNFQAATVNPTNSVYDYNRYFSAYTPIANYYIISWRTGAYGTLSDWRTWTSNDLNSAVSDPLVQSVSGLPSEWNLHPTALSTLPTSGTNLYALMVSIGADPVDYDGVALPSSGAWPIGAYATTGDAPPPTPPTPNQSPALPLRFLRP